MFPIVEQQKHTSSQNQNKLSPLCVFLINPVEESFISCVSQKMNIHMNLNLNEMDNMIYQDPRRIKEEEDIVAAKTFSEEEDSSSCSLSSMCSSSDLTEEDDDDDASSSSSNGPLHDLSDLMSHLPIKRGLSKFYEGKSQSFTSLGNVKSLEDLMKSGFKNRKNYGARRKLCKSTGGIIDQSYKNVYSPKATISKKSTTRTPSSTLSCLSRRRH